MAVVYTRSQLSFYFRPQFKVTESEIGPMSISTALGPFWKVLIPGSCTEFRGRPPGRGYRARYIWVCVCWVGLLLF